MIMRRVEMMRRVVMMKVPCLVALLGSYLIDLIALLDLIGTMILCV